MNTFWPVWRENPLMTVLVSVFLVSCITLVGFKVRSLDTERNYIGYTRDTFTIEGEGKVTGKPTLAQLEVGLYSEGMDVASVQDDNSKKVSQIISALKQMGIAEDDMQTSNYYISPKFEYKDGNQKVVGYTVTQTLMVKIRALTKVGDVLAKAAQAGANQINGLSFTIDDPKELKQQARKKAIADAQAKARELADALGARVVRVVTFSEYSGGISAPYPLYREMGGGGVSAISAPDIQSGSLDVASRVSVTFEVR